MPPNYIIHSRNLAHYTQNVCLLYPDEDYALFIETDKPFWRDNKKTCNKDVYNLIMDTANKKFAEYPREPLKKGLRYTIDYNPIEQADYIDFNYDGIKDYKFYFYYGITRVC